MSGSAGPRHGWSQTASQPPISSGSATASRVPERRSFYGVVVFLTWLLGSSFLFACFGVAAAQALGMRPRARVWIRLAVSALVLAALSLAVVESVSSGLLPWSDGGGP